MKNSRKTRVMIPILIAIFAIVLISSISIFIYMLSGNYINYAHIDNSAVKVNNTTAKDSNIIILNGIVLGANKNGNWISSQKFLEANGSTGKTEVNLYSVNSLYGTFETASLKNANSVVYTTIAKDILPKEYLAVSANLSKGYVNVKTQEATKQDEKYVKDALGGYTLLNGSVNITECVNAKIKENDDKIICVTAKKANLLGVYSAVIYVTGSKAYLVKYSYVRDTGNSVKWPVYSLKFVHDLDGEGAPEIILEEVTGNDVKYVVLELRENNTFYQVLTTSIEL